MTKPEKPHPDPTDAGWTEAEKQVGAAHPPGEAAVPATPKGSPSGDRSASESAAARIAAETRKPG